MSITINREIMTKGWKYFDIMNINRRVVRIHEDGKCKIYYPTFMPYNLYLEESDDFHSRVNNLNNFYYWCSSRVLTLDRKYAKEILRTIGANQAEPIKKSSILSTSFCLFAIFKAPDFPIKRTRFHI